MFKRKEYSERVTKTLNFESRVYSDFEKLCTEERTYPSHRLQELMVGELEKKGVGAMDPLNIRYHKQEEKPLQTDLTQWLDIVAQVQGQKELSKLKSQAMSICSRVDKRSMELYWQGIKE
jgi:hypothetical protein